MLLQNKNYFLWLIIMAMCYFVFEIFFIPHAALVRDEFWNSHHIYQYVHSVPYRDFIPYKSVLGYYILSIPMLIFSKMHIPIYYIKQEIAFINTLSIILLGILAKRFFQPRAIILTLAIIIASQLFLVVSVDIRIDMLSMWIALFSILYFLSNRVILSGILLTTAFLISQKALWFFIATNTAILVNTLYFRDYKNQIANFMKFNVSIAILLSAYVAFWTYQSNLDSVLGSLFYDGYTQSKITWYQGIYVTSWHIVLTLGPLLIMMLPLTWLALCSTYSNTQQHKLSLFIVTYASIMLALMISYQQPFLYNMIFLIPGFFVLYSHFITLILNEKLNFTNVFRKKMVVFLFFYSLSLLYLIAWMHLSLGTYLVILLPILFYLMQYHHSNIAYTLSILVILFTGIIFPLISSTSNISAYIQYGKYQRENIQVANTLLSEGGEYFAGTPIFYFRDQAINGLKNLIGPQLEYINHPTAQLQPILLTSLYLSATNIDAILKDLKSAPVKLYIRNNRIDSLPHEITTYLTSQYEHLYGSIYLYAPTIASQEDYFQLKFNGRYLVECDYKDRFEVNNQQVHCGDYIELMKGTHQSKSNKVYRLKFTPKNLIVTDSRFQEYAPTMLASI